ncbi:hypothetical protein SOASR030_13630 [Leminorella grimontii]|uniref:Uncharacterized protein n=1 Tax=Leminorella grimontii TaxID=82981 RepID=A0AAV5MZG6_9GAMM|nr:hypothetical protein SOASR030_13630 [Leminorella grimontii]GKX58656.1 hypothetical protein SOASR031_09710 [Leminorella grimontii]
MRDIIKTYLPTDNALRSIITGLTVDRKNAFIIIMKNKTIISRNFKVPMNKRMSREAANAFSTVRTYGKK